MQRVKRILGGLALLVAGAATRQLQDQKTFGVGHGPAYLGGSEAGEQRTKIAFNIYNQLINYKIFIQESTLKDMQYHER